MATPTNNNAKDSVIVITGGSSGIGLSVAKAFLLHGAKGVVISGRTQKKLDAAVSELLDSAEPKEIGGIKRVLGVPSDVASWEETQALMKTAFDTYHQLDYVLANATGSDSDASSLDIFKKPDYDSTYTIIQGVANTVHAAVGYLTAPAGSTNAIGSMEEFSAQDQSSRRDKAIVITGSQASLVEYDLHPPYGTAKGAINSYVWTNRTRLAKAGIRINCVAPAWVDTPMLTPLVVLGIVLPEHIIPVGSVTDAAMRFFNDSAISGVVTSIPIPAPDVKTIDIPPAPLDKRFQIMIHLMLFANAKYPLARPPLRLSNIKDLKLV
ncbi:NAD(P)-binding protein [Clavulina sp. PMI_390]|nr:NAD(P)-binding protein [Clavulina sp. PMI_390]